MPNDEEVIVDLNNESGEETEAPKEPGEETPAEKDKPAEKPAETLEARKARLERQLEQTNKKLGIEPQKPEKKSGKSSGLDYGQMAFLLASGIKNEEMDFVKEELKNSNMELSSLVANTYFQAKLKEMRETKETSNAVPPGSKRTGQSAQNTVEYWIAKGELPPLSEQKLRQDVVNARMKAEKSKSMFTDTPVTGHIN